ncbi:hypothetical protein CEXT_769791 [Caerostris extrusa]|uniref:Uncharacterized protein n=1 Tax=Caerostris extrusa TaxID=172846 RepID=A0AAV4UFW6_CAEEX|nr:hypothetical protein CEXT_769791 [Caerostris extrusa]
MSITYRNCKTRHQHSFFQLDSLADDKLELKFNISISRVRQTYCNTAFTYYGPLSLINFLGIPNFKKIPQLTSLRTQLRLLKLKGKSSTHLVAQYPQ